MAPNKNQSDSGRLDRIVADAQRAREQREQSYREQALKLYPWVCGRCAREFTRADLEQLTVHHRDHNHDNNPPDGSNWELLCIYCHDNEHGRLEVAEAYDDSTAAKESTGGDFSHKPFAALGELLKGRQK